MVIKDPKKYFYARNGAILKDLDDLLNFVRNSDGDSLNHHFNSEKNDFASWVKEVLKKSMLSKKLEKSKSREELVSVVESELMKSRKVNKRAAISAIKKSVRNK